MRYVLSVFLLSLYIHFHKETKFSEMKKSTEILPSNLVDESLYSYPTSLLFSFFISIFVSS